MACSTMLRASTAAPVATRRAPATSSVRASASLRVVAKASSSNGEVSNVSRPLQLAAATFAAAALLVSGQPALAAGGVPGVGPNAGLTKPNGEVSTGGLGQKVADAVSNLFPKGAFDKAEETLAPPASSTKSQEIKSVTQMLNEVADPSPARNSSIRAAAKGEPDIDPTLVGKNQSAKLGPSSDPAYKQTEANVPLITNKA